MNGVDSNQPNLAFELEYFTNEPRGNCHENTATSQNLYEETEQQSNFLFPRPSQVAHKNL